MKPSEDRRCHTATRIGHTALVDICSLSEDKSPFQAESSNISGRGMHVRGSYLPEIGESLVCRFHHEEEEILVEGRVAWRSEGEDGGEFGLQFTALDADSAELLQGLGQKRATQKTFSVLAATAKEQEEHEQPRSFELEAGERVRLHVEGLGAPMKASVRQGGARRVKVSSALEFLKMGRSVELEEVIGGVKRGARVDSVNVVVHPTTSVPELVVQLRYEGISPTPPPARAALPQDAETTAAQSARPSADESYSEHSAFDEHEEQPWQPAADALRHRLGEAMQSAGSAAARAGGLLSAFTKSTKEKLPGREAKPIRKTRGTTRKRSTSLPAEAVRRRTQAPSVSRAAPTHLRSGIHDLNLARGADRKRPTQNAKERPESPSKATASRKRGPAIVALGAFLLLGGSAFALRSMGDAGPAPGLSKSASQQSKVKESASTPQGAKAAMTKGPKTKEPEAEGGIVAEVPLFGPQAVAPGNKPKEESAAEVAESEKRAAAAAVSDQSFDEAEPAEAASTAKPWGRGRMYLPTIHRIRLDSAGQGVAGAMHSDGFTVVIPGRKVMESGKAIQKRDKRIVAVKAENEGPNAKVRFEFRGPVPPYRVRLRQDFVEFLISAPEESVAHL